MTIRLLFYETTFIFGLALFESLSSSLQPPEQCFFFSSRAQAAHLSPFQRCHSLSKRLFKSCSFRSVLAEMTQLRISLMIQWCGFPKDQQFLLACTFQEDNIINSWKAGIGGRRRRTKKGLAWHTNAFKREGPGKWMSEDAERRGRRSLLLARWIREGRFIGKDWNFSHYLSSFEHLACLASQVTKKATKIF